MKADPRKLMESALASWEALAPGLERLTLEEGTELYRLGSEQALPAEALEPGFEILVLEGTLLLDQGSLGPEGYAREPEYAGGTLRSPEGCELLLKHGPFAPGDRQRLCLQSSQMPWLPGQGNLRVKPLHHFEGFNTALVHWPAGEHFVPHRHFGGEEVFVLSGTFEDEHGRYPKGTWIQSPHLSQHHPFVTEETVIFVKTGHLHPGLA